MQEYSFEPTIFTDFFADPPVRLAEKLKQLTGYDRLFLCNSEWYRVCWGGHQIGNVETAQAECVGLLRCLSRRTLGSLSLTCSMVKHKASFEIPLDVVAASIQAGKQLLAWFQQLVGSRWMTIWRIPATSYNPVYAVTLRSTQIHRFARNFRYTQTVTLKSRI